MAHGVNSRWGEAAKLKSLVVPLAAGGPKDLGADPDAILMEVHVP
jgi:hypothetical protein